MEYGCSKHRVEKSSKSFKLHSGYQQQNLPSEHGLWNVVKDLNDLQVAATPEPIVQKYPREQWVHRIPRIRAEKRVEEWNWRFRAGADQEQDTDDLQAGSLVQDAELNYKGQVEVADSPRCQLCHRGWRWRQTKERNQEGETAIVH